MKRLEKWLPLLTLILLSYVVIFHFYEKGLTHPGTHLMEDGRDGLKNYYTPAYYLKHGKGLMHDGFNYPYSEHIVFTDNQPLFVVILKFIDNNIYPVGDYGIHFVNFFLFFSLGFAPVFLWLILRKFGVDKWFAIPFALAIGFLSPQILRTFSHYALAYTWYVPMLWYWLIRFQEGQKKWLWGGLSLLTVLAFGFIHTYYTPIGAMFVIALAMVYTIANLKNLKTHLPHILQLLIIAIIPLVIFTVFMEQTDPYTDRVGEPWGFFHYNAKIEGVFFRPISDWFQTVFQWIAPIKHVEFEGQNSVGFGGLLLLIWGIFRYGRFILKKQFSRFFLGVKNKTLNQFFFASIIVLIFALGIPFVWYKPSLDFVSLLKQFRSIGRFAWVFYYVYSVYVVYFLYLVYRKVKLKRKWLAIVFTTLFVAIWSIEAYMHVKSVSKFNTSYEMFREDSIFTKYPHYLDSLPNYGYQIEDFQAVLILPFFHTGSEKITIWNGEKSFQQAIRISYHTGLPIIGNLSARAPIGRSLKAVQMLSSDFIEKEVMTELSDQPILLGLYRGAEDEEDLAFVKKAKYLYTVDQLDIYVLEKKGFIPNFKAQTTIYLNRKDSLINGDSNGMKYKSTKDDFVYMNGFDDNTTEIKLRGKGATFFDNKKREGFDIYNAQLMSLDTTVKMFELTFWVYADTQKAYIPNLYHEIWNDTTGYMIKKDGVRIFNTPEVYNGWIKCTRLIPNDNAYRHHLFLTDFDRIIIDDMLIRPVNIDVYWGETDSTFILNNYTIKKQ